jgi:NAD(P)-dependent dehydrogenase (short-subunit alcohol dehydrogenase family)
MAINVAKRGVGVILTYNSHPDEGAAVAAEINNNGGKAVALKLDVTQIKFFSEFAGTVQKTLEKDFGQKNYDYLVNDGGQIINISTGLTRFSHPGVATYASLKAAMECLTVYLAKEYGSRKIRANVVAPGAVQSDFGGGKNEEADKLISSQTALGRLGQTDDIGLLVASLLSDDSRWVNAQRIEASGGMYI